MVALVVVLILAAVIVGLAVSRRVFRSDARSIAGHHSKMEGLRRLDRTVATSGGHDLDAVPGMRVVEQNAHRSGLFPVSTLEQEHGAVLIDDTLVRDEIPSGGEPAVETASINRPVTAAWGEQQNTAPYDHGGWGPPVHEGWGPPVEPAQRAQPTSPTVPDGSPSPAAGNGDDERFPVLSAAPLFEEYAPASEFDEPTPPEGGPASDRRGLHRRTSPPHRFMSRKLAIALGVIAIVAIVVSVVAVSAGGGRPHPASSAQHRLGGPASSSPHSSAPPAARHPVTVQPRPVPTTAHARPPVRRAPRPVRTALPSSGPGIAAISPASGVAGQVVTLTGRNLFSHSGLIVVRFGSAQASVACPLQSACRATVPAQPSGQPGTVEVTLSTDSATSNPVVFTYR